MNNNYESYFPSFGGIKIVQTQHSYCFVLQRKLSYSIKYVVYVIARQRYRGDYRIIKLKAGRTDQSVAMLLLGPEVSLNSVLLTQKG